MMSLRLLSSFRNIPIYLKQSSSQVHTSVILLNSKDSSSSLSSSDSSDSSDSDSDKENEKKEKFSGKTTSANLKDAQETLKTSDTNERLNILLQKINEASQKMKTNVPSIEKEINIEGLPSFIPGKVRTTEFAPKLNKKINIKKDVDMTPPVNKKTVNVAIKPKKIRFNQINAEEKLKQKPHEYQIQQAVKDVAKTLGGDTHKTELELLTKALNLKQESSDPVSVSKEEGKSLDLRDLLTKMKIDSPSPDGNLDATSGKFQNAKSRFREPSVAESILYKKSITKPRRYVQPPVEELKVAHPALGILKKIPASDKDEMPLPTWHAMESREMRLATVTVPQNVFQELIEWTNDGKIWRFPINNEQGMEDEKDVHFSQHVFMDRHLKGWCPRKGPIRHFMELVCTGLSKNPYMTVEEKEGHIAWYKNYFEDKKELLHELGVLDDKTTQIPPTDKKQIEA